MKAPSSVSRRLRCQADEQQYGDTRPESKVYARLEGPESIPSLNKFASAAWSRNRTWATYKGFNNFLVVALIRKKQKEMK